MNKGRKDENSGIVGFIISKFIASIHSWRVWLLGLGIMWLYRYSGHQSLKILRFIL